MEEENSNNNNNNNGIDLLISATLEINDNISIGSVNQEEINNPPPSPNNDDHPIIADP
jgi:hypothetical protein